MFENLDTLTIVIILAIAIFLVAAIILVVMLLTGNRQNTNPDFVRLPKDRTQGGGGKTRAGTRAATSAMVVCVTGKNEGKRVGFDNGKITIGRDSSNDLVLDEPLISRVHAEVKYDGGTFWLEDPGSVNGIWMKGQRVLQMKLKDGDQFRVGRSTFALVMPGSGAPQAQADEDRAPQRPRRAINPTLEGYEFEGKIAEGGQAVVFKARNMQTGQIVAIKYLANLPYDADGQYFRAKFEQQIAIGTTIRHPHCVQILGGNSKGEVPYLIEEYLPGGTLADKLKNGQRLNQNDIGIIVGQLCDALGYLHGRGIIHRDIAPGNIMFDARMQSKLIDFGIAHVSSAPTKTAIGMLVGKAKYMSVEQARGDVASEQSDLYSLGVIAYQMATGKTPFDGADLDVIRQHLESKPPRPRELVPALSDQLDFAILKALEKDPAKRFANAREMATAFNYFKTFSVGENTMSYEQPETTQSTTGNAHAAMPHRPKLRVVQTGRVIPIISTRMILARDVVNAADKTISRQNGQIYRQNEVWWISEMPNQTSQNGIYVNGERVVEAKPILVGDVIKLGETEIEVME